MTLDVPHVRPATSCGSVSIAIRSDTLKKKRTKLQSPVALVRSSRKASVELPELTDSDDIDDCKCSGRRNSCTVVQATRNAPIVAAIAAPTTRERTVVDRTLQLTTMLRSEQTKLSQQLLIASEKGHSHAAYLLLHQQLDRDRCRGMVRWLIIALATTPKSSRSCD